MFDKILIANRGEIACRVAATACRLGVRTVAVYSTADAGAAHVAACDEAILVGDAAPAQSYLHGERIIAAAVRTGARAVHPGYGFLSENAGFAEACAAAGLVFIGPPPAALRAMGLKAEAKRLMAAAGVPLVPGYHEADQDDAVLAEAAARIGYPVLIKASAGGGGKGMRVVEEASGFAAALAACRREAAASFGNDAVLVERYVQRPRHIEIQVFGDTHGGCVHLFERDCSVQRRHQKVLEESPAPGMTPERRARMGAAAVAAARAVGYVGAGTVEFIAEQDGSFYFMEMNTRLQVEHPVTEAVTGLDLVEWQLRVAAGEPLPLAQDAIRLRGHAIEARLCAEDPGRDFLPATGRLDVLALPPHAAFGPGAAVRVDAGVRAGDVVTPHYDSMIAKLIVHGATRAQALARLDRALGATRIVGVANNAAFLRRVAASAAFAGADLDTGLIARERDRLFAPEALPPARAAAALLAAQLAEEVAAPAAGPWGARDGWRLGAPGGRTLRWHADDAGTVAEATCTPAGDASWRLAVGDAAAILVVQQATPTAPGGGLAGWRHDLELDGCRWRCVTYAAGDGLAVFADDGRTVLRPVDAGVRAPDAADPAGRPAAPMPGKVVSFLVAAGETVRRGQPLALMEAMKMEHTIVAPHDGTVAELLYAPGEAVPGGAELLRLEAAVAP